MHFLLCLSTLCLVPAARVSAREPEVTYAKRIAPILQKHCQVCHHPGTAAPFSLLTYDDAVKWADNIREAVVDGRMPPWFADPRFGRFSNDPRLKPADLKAVLAWLDTGMKFGNKNDLPPGRKYEDGWLLGKPDVVVTMPKEQEIPAAGTMPYQYYVTRMDFAEDVFVQAIEAFPGDRTVVHHLDVNFLGNGPTIFNYGPGVPPLSLPPDCAIRIPARQHLLWNLHYTPNGKPTRDRSALGLTFYRGSKPPKYLYEFVIVGFGNGNWAIPPGDPNYRVDSEWVVPHDMRLIWLEPHMHLRGKDFDFRVLYPDGRSDTLLFVPHYDFNWQLMYWLEEPLVLPKGAKILCTAHYDNSSSNPNNPDPTKEIHWGQQSDEEMMHGGMGVIYEPQPAAVPAEPAPPATGNRGVAITAVACGLSAVLLISLARARLARYCRSGLQWCKLM